MAARRAVISGKEHPLTLLTNASKGKILAAVGDTEKAVKLMRETLDIAERNMGSKNLAVLAGKAWYAGVLAQHGDLEAAEAYLAEATDMANYAQAAARMATTPIASSTYGG